MKKYLVIGNPIEHSLSPKLHNYWIKKNKIDAVYDKKLVNEDEIEDIIFKVKKGEIDGINVTVPFKKSVIPFLEELSPEANESQSVNTIYKENITSKYKPLNYLLLFLKVLLLCQSILCCFGQSLMI